MNPVTFDKQPVLESDRIALRPLAVDDYQALYLVAADPELWALHPARDRWQEPVFRELFNTAMQSGGTMVAIDKASGVLIGSSRYNVPSPHLARAEIGWSFLARDRWGGDWNREIKRLLLAHAFRFVETVYFRVAETNIRSRRAMEKLGAVLARDTDVLVMPDGSAVTHVIFEITKADFSKW